MKSSSSESSELTFGTMSFVWAANVVKAGASLDGRVYDVAHEINCGFASSH